MKKQHIELSDSQITELQGMLKSGTLPARIYQRIQVLLNLHQGKNYRIVSEDLSLGYSTVRSLAGKYKIVGLSCLYDLPRSGRPIRISGASRAKITALACSEVAEGRHSWTLRLLSEKAVELGLVAQISHTYVGSILKKTS